MPGLEKSRDSKVRQGKYDFLLTSSISFIVRCLWVITLQNMRLKLKCKRIKRHQEDEPKIVLFIDEDLVGCCTYSCIFVLLLLLLHNLEMLLEPGHGNYSI